MRKCLPLACQRGGQWAPPPPATPSCRIAHALCAHFINSLVRVTRSRQERGGASAPVTPILQLGSSSSSSSASKQGEVAGQRCDGCGGEGDSDSDHLLPRKTEGDGLGLFSEPQQPLPKSPPPLSPTSDDICSSAFLSPLPHQDLPPALELSSLVLSPARPAPNPISLLNAPLHSEPLS